MEAEAPERLRLHEAPARELRQPGLDLVRLLRGREGRERRAGEHSPDHGGALQ